MPTPYRLRELNTKARTRSSGLGKTNLFERNYGPSLCGGVLAAFGQVTLGVEATVPPNT